MATTDESIHGRDAGGSEERQPTATERILIGIWARIFTRDDIGVDDDFVDLGGDSIIMMEMLFGVREALAVDLAPEAVFAAATLREIAKQIDAGRSAVGAAEAGRATPS